jgi:hypothetical protein
MQDNNCYRCKAKISLSERDRDRENIFVYICQCEHIVGYDIKNIADWTDKYKNTTFFICHYCRNQDTGKMSRKFHFKDFKITGAL